MAEEEEKKEESKEERKEEAEFDENECQACRGRGKVVSNLGGEPKDVECPWCEGTKRFIPEHDAQARFKEEDPAAAE